MHILQLRTSKAHSEARAPPLGAEDAWSGNVHKCNELLEIRFPILNVTVPLQLLVTAILM